MQADHIAGKWNKFRPMVREKPYDSDGGRRRTIPGGRHRLLGAIRECLVSARDRTQRQIKQWERRGERLFDITARRTNTLLQNLDL